MLVLLRTIGICPTEAPPGHAPRGKKQSHHRRHKVLSNDELFYDPTMDDRDQEWVNQKRRSYQPRGRRYSIILWLHFYIYFINITVISVFLFCRGHMALTGQFMKNQEREAVYKHSNPNR